MPLILSPNLRGALFMAVSMAGFTLNDSLVKLASADLNMGQIMCVRGLFATILVTLLAWHQGALRAAGQIIQPLVVVRAVGELGGTISFLVALAHLPIANVSAVLQALPLAVTMGAALVFGEKVGWRRWLAIVVGFAGVMIIVRPGFEGFSVYAVLTLLSVAFCTVRDLSTRQIPNTVPALLISVTTAASVTICGALLVPAFGGWRPMTSTNVATLGGASVLLIIGYHCIIMAMRSGDISFIAPFRYTALLWALLLGYVLFSDVPDLAMISGATIIVGSGLYTLYRERIVGRRLPAAQSTSPSMVPDGL